LIKSFGCKETEKIGGGKRSTDFPLDIQQRALRKLRQLDASLSLEDLKNPPGNRLENLKGDRQGYMSLRINNQWRLCFLWHNNEAFDVKIVDYH
jgi:proteic killer suppression protein